MTKFGFCTVWLLVAACGGDARDAAALSASRNPAPTPKRGYLRDPGHEARPDVQAARPIAAEPMDPALVGPNQPENVQVKP
jgi:hypothetical protein